MKAAEIKEIAKNANKESKALADIENSILSAAKKGEYRTWVYINIHPDVREELTKMGYTVGETQFDRNETLTEISWA